MSTNPNPRDTPRSSTVLVVDDEPLYLQVLVDLLLPFYQVRAVLSGERALATLTADTLPDLILLDVLMPGMDGFTLLQQLQANPATHDIPVIFITALNDDDSEQRGLELGAVDYVHKPLKPLTVLARVRAQLEAKAARDLLRSTNLRLKAQISEDTHALAQAQDKLLQMEKLTAMGQLAAGIAHEINNPIGFVSSNLHTLTCYTQDLLALLNAYAQAASQIGNHPALEQVGAVRRKMDLDFIRQDALDLLHESQEGMERVRRLVRDLKDFSRSSNQDWQWADVHQGLESTLNLLRSEIKQRATVVKHYGELPPIHCLPHQLNQVFMNLLINALQAMAQPGTITLRTDRLGEALVRITVADTGQGMAPEVLAQLFDAFYTTKPMGQGTGLGLSLSRSIIERHGGQIEVSSVPGQGSTFTITLPVDACAAPASAPDTL